jgi:hypothetical protein
MGAITPPSPVEAERNSSRRIIFVAVAAVLAVMVGIALLLRETPRQVAGPPPYAANLKLSDFKMSAAENFVGATVSYIDGTVTNTGDKTVTRAVVEVVFKDELAQVVQREIVPLRALKTGGPYAEAVDLAASPLGPSQGQPFRLTFDSISAQWNRQYPDIRIVEVSAK